MKTDLQIVPRGWWLDRIEEAWRRRSIVWLSGVRRVGKTCLVKSIPGCRYLDCELPRIRRRLEDMESFLDDMGPGRIALDEIHKLPDPSSLLKIAADHYPSIEIIATGSSSLGASKKFEDTLVGRKEELWLTPMTTYDMVDFGTTSLDRRLVRGGLPPFFLAEETPERDCQEWMDGFWAKEDRKSVV
jgi:uncharacterized protein